MSMCLHTLDWCEGLLLFFVTVIIIVITIMFNTYPECHPAEVSPAKNQTGVVTSDTVHPYSTAAILDLKRDWTAMNKYSILRWCMLLFLHIPQKIKAR